MSTMRSDGRNKRRILAVPVVGIGILGWGAAPARPASKPRNSVVVRCVGLAGSGFVVQVEPPTKGIGVRLRSGAKGPPRTAKTDVAGRAQLPGAGATQVFVAVQGGPARPFTPGACPVSASLVQGASFIPVQAAMKSRGPATLGFGIGELVVPGGSVNNGVVVQVRRGTKSYATPDAVAESLSGPIEIGTDRAVVFRKPMQASFIVALTPGGCGDSPIRVLFTPLGQDKSQILVPNHRDLVVTVAIPGPGTVEVVRVNPTNRARGPVGTFSLVSLAGPPSATATGAVRDYFTDTFSDPLDYDNPQDHALVAEGPTQGNTSSSISGGQLHLVFDQPGYFSPVWGGYNVAGNGREANVHPVDGRRYRRFRVRMNASASVGAGIFFFTCPFGVNDSCQTGTQFVTTPGWKVYEADVPSGDVTGARVAISPSSGPVSVDVDWVQILANEPGNVLDDGSVPGPVPEVLNPDVAGAVPALFPNNGTPITYQGATDCAHGDWATLVRRDPWDFAQPSDVAGVDNYRTWAVANGEFDGIGVNGTDGGAPGDPGIRLNLNGYVIDPTLSHRLTVHVPRWDGTYSQQFRENGGWVFRALWKFDPKNRGFQVTNPIVEYPSIKTISVDLADPNPFDGVASPPPGNNDPEAPGQLGWNVPGRVVPLLRIDMAEPYRDRHTPVDSVWLGTDDWAVGTVDIVFRDVNPLPGTNAELFESATPNGPWRAIGTTPVVDGLTTYEWQNAPSGTHWIKVRLTRGTLSGEAVSTGPVQVGTDLAAQVIARSGAAR